VYQEDKVIVLYEFCSCISMPVWLKARAEGTLLFTAFHAKFPVVDTVVNM